MPEVVTNSGINKVLRGYYKSQLGTLVSACAEKDGALEISSNLLDCARWNHSAWLGGRGAELHDYLAKSQFHSQETGRKHAIYLSEDSMDAATRSFLGKAGYEPFEEEVWLEWQQGRSENLKPLGTARIAELDDQLLPDFLELFTTLFNAAGPSLVEAVESFSCKSSDKLRYFICQDNSRKSIGIASISVHEETGSVIHLALLPKSNSAEQAELARLLLQQLSAQRPVFLQVTGAGCAAANFEELGFRLQFTRAGYRLKQAATRQADPVEPESEIQTIQYNTANLARQYQVNRETLLIAAWAYLVNRYTGGDTASFFVRQKNGVVSPVRISIAPEESISQWLKRIEDSYFDNVEPIGASAVIPKVDKLNFEQSISASVLDLSENNPEVTPDFPLEVRFSGIVSDTLSITYRAEFCNSAAVQRLAGQLFTIFGSLADSTSLLVRDIELLPVDQREAVLKGFNRTELPYPASKAIHCLIEEQAALNPAAAALVTDRERLTYKDFNERANRLANYLRSIGAGPDRLVAICCERTADLVIAMIAVVKSGSAYVPIDPAYPKDRIKFIIEDANAPIILTVEHLAAQLPSTGAKVVLLDRVDLSEQSSQNPPCDVNDANLAYVIFTSGSTGRPKGVAIEHRSVIAFAEWAKTVFSKDDLDGVLFATSVCFDLSIFEVFVTLALGGKIVLAETALHLPGLQSVSEVTLINTVPSAIAELARMQAIPASVKIINLAGEPLKQALVEELYKVQTVQKVYDLYGPTEDTVYSTFTLRQPGARATIGKPIANTRAYILDDQLRPVPIGVPGELHLAGAGLARGYLNRPELTAEKFILDPFSTKAGEKMYKTGDLTRFLPDGTIEYLGRIDHQVKIRGYRIELGEIENAIRSHPAVLETATVARTEQTGEKKIVSYVVGDPDWQAAKQKSEQDDQVSGWEVVFDAAYSQSSSTTDTEFNIASWNSSYDGKPIPAEQMREWRDQTVERILELKPKRVLEIGCGTGLLLFKIAPHCELYEGTDISGTVLNDLASRVRHLPQVKLSQKKADELAGYQQQSFDTIIINSVIQYFPSAAYLLNVLEGAARLLVPGGRIFVGDPRNYKLLNAFCCDIELTNAPDDLPNSDLKKRVDQKVLEEKELLVDPQFFLSLPTKVTELTSVEVMPKAATFLNEMSCFRYDAILHCRNTHPVLQPNWTDWAKSRLSLEKLKGLLQERKQLLAIKNVPNARVVSAVNAVEVLHNPEFSTAGEIRSQSKAPATAVHPAEVIRLASELGFKTYLSWAGSTETGSFHAVFDPDTNVRKVIHTSGLVSSGKQRLSSLTNNPLKKNLQTDLLPGIKNIVSEKLPEYMMPSAFVFLDALPLTPNGKLNRKALPDPDYTTDLPRGPVKEPQNPLELQLKLIFEKFLKRRPIGTDVSFFELGGDSLQALSLIVEIERFTGKKIPLSILYESATVETLAGSIEKASGPLEKKALVPLQPFGTKRPLFLVHTNPGDVLGYGNLVYHLGSDQPCYGFQSLGLLNEEWRHTTIEEMAAWYVREMRERQPEGPYLLGGWCYGGIVAAEMAQQLQKAGEKVALLALFETPAPAPPLRHYVYYLNRVSRLFRMKPARLRQYLSEKWKYYRGLKTTNAVRFQRVDKHETGSAEEIARKNQLLAKLELIYNTNSYALANYSARFYPGKVILFNAVEQDPALIDDPNYGWKGMASDIITHTLPGNHDSILAEPNVGELATKLREHLESIQPA